MLGASTLGGRAPNQAANLCLQDLHEPNPIYLTPEWSDNRPFVILYPRDVHSRAEPKLFLKKILTCRRGMALLYVPQTR